MATLKNQHLVFTCRFLLFLLFKTYIESATGNTNKELMSQSQGDDEICIIYRRKMKTIGIYSIYF